MQARIHVFGASGSGVTTLGAALAAELRCPHLDTDHFYWVHTDPPFTDKVEPAERVRAIQAKTHGLESWVLSGSLCSWGDPLLDQFTHLVFLRLDGTQRLRRLRDREQQRYGDRIQPGGDMRRQHLDFMRWAKLYEKGRAPLRSLHLHRQWLLRMTCPVIELDSSASVQNLVAATVRFLKRGPIGSERRRFARLRWVGYSHLPLGRNFLSKRASTLCTRSV
ncbi:MAG: AAA family ATPase [Pseudomonadota bacterium]